MIIFWSAITSLLVLCNAIALSAIVSLKRDLKDYEAIIESTMENNNKLIQINENVMQENLSLHDRFERVEKICLKQNELSESVLKDNMEITQRVNEVLMHIDDGK